MLLQCKQNQSIKKYETSGIEFCLISNVPYPLRAKRRNIKLIFLMLEIPQCKTQFFVVICKRGETMSQKVNLIKYLYDTLRLNHIIF